jgi:hypothetical protein
MGSGSVQSGFGVRGWCFVIVLVLVLERELGSVGAPIVQSNPVCSTYLHIVVERLFEDEDYDKYEDDFRPFASLKTC